MYPLHPFDTIEHLLTLKRSQHPSIVYNDIGLDILYFPFGICMYPLHPYDTIEISLTLKRSQHPSKEYNEIGLDILYFPLDFACILTIHMVPSWELTYPLFKAFLRLCSFYPGGIC